MLIDANHRIHINIEKIGNATYDLGLKTGDYKESNELNYNFGVIISQIIENTHSFSTQTIASEFMKIIDDYIENKRIEKEESIERQKQADKEYAEANREVITLKSGNLGASFVFEFKLYDGQKTLVRVNKIKLRDESLTDVDSKHVTLYVDNDYDGTNFEFNVTVNHSSFGSVGPDEEEEFVKDVQSNIDIARQLQNEINKH